MAIQSSVSKGPQWWAILKKMLMGSRQKRILSVTAALITVFLLYMHNRNWGAVNVQPKKDLRGKGNVDEVFFRRIRILLRVVIPTWKCYEVLDLCMLTVFLVLRTFMSIFLAGVNGKIVKAIIEKDFSLFVSRVLKLGILAIPASFVNSFLDFLNKRLAIRFKKRLTDHFHSMYLKDKIFYQIGSLDSRVTNPDQRLTADIDRWATSLSTIYSNISKPTLDIFLFSRKLAELVGWQGPTAIILWYLASGVVLKFISPAFGKMAAIEQRLEGDYRSAHSNIEHHSEQIAFYKGNAWQLTRIASSYNYSVIETDIMHDSIHYYPRDLPPTQLQHHQYVDFDEGTFNSLYDRTNKLKPLVKGLRYAYKQFFGRVAIFLLSETLKLLPTPLPDKALTLTKDDQEFKIESMRGNIPSKWPENMGFFARQIAGLPWNAFSNDAPQLLTDFIQSVKTAILKQCAHLHKQNNPSPNIEMLQQEIQILFEIVLRTTNLSQVLGALLFLNKVREQVGEELEGRLAIRLHYFIEEYLRQVHASVKEKKNLQQAMQYNSTTWVVKKAFFDKVPKFHCTGLACDGKYIYLYVSTTTGGLFKIGTGQQNTEPGKVYVEKYFNNTKVEEVKIVYLKHKLYLRSAALWTLEVFNADTLESEYKVKLLIPNLCNALTNINRIYPVMSDGDALYIIGNRIRNQIAVNEGNEKVQENKKKGKKGQEKEEEQNKTPKRVLEIVLYKFNLEEVKEEITVYPPAVQQIHECLNGCYSKKQCYDAYFQSGQNVSEAFDWLLDKQLKKKQKEIKQFRPCSATVLAESEITSNFQEQNIKGYNEITCKQGSVLTINNVFELLWVVTKSAVVCFSQTGVKVFSKDVPCTLLRTLETNVAKNPQYNVTYCDKVLYLFSWRDHHSFPAAIVSVSFDENPSVEWLEGREAIDNFKSVGRDLVRRSMELGIHTGKYTYSSWEWMYAQKIIEVSKEKENNESDRKRLANKRIKLFSKLNKIVEINKTFSKDMCEFNKNKRVVKEVVKVHAFATDGTLAQLKLIEQLYQQQISQEYLALVTNWINNSDHFKYHQCKEIINRIREKLMRNGGPLRNQIHLLLVSQFYAFFPTVNEQIPFIMAMDKQYFQQLNHALRQNGRKQRHSITYQITKQEYIILKYEAKIDLQQIFKNVSNIDNTQNEHQQIGNVFFNQILTSKLQAIDPLLRTKFFLFLQDSILKDKRGIRLFQQVFLSALFLLYQIKDQSTYLRLFNDLFLQCFKCLQSILQKCNNDRCIEITNLITFVVGVYHGSAAAQCPKSQHISSLMRMLVHLQRSELMEVFKYVDAMEFEGISATLENTYETAHPMPRGKHWSFPPCFFDHACATLMELDKRCQADANNDYMHIRMHYGDQPTPSTCEDTAFFHSLKNPDAKTPYLFPGNSVGVEFNSNCNAKNAESFTRYGFKLGLRPVFAGRGSYDLAYKTHLLGLFKTIPLFKQYFCTLKLLTVVTQGAIEKSIRKQESTVEQIANILKGRIFEQGFQQNSHVYPTLKEDTEERISAFMEVEKHEAVELEIIKTTHLNRNLKKVQKKEKVEVEVEKEQLWNFKGTPTYLREYLEQIKVYEGDFIELFKKAREQVKEKGAYAQISKKPSFIKEHKKLWEQGEALLFLTVLKHSGLLHLNLKFSIQYIKENLKAFQEARDRIFFAFISRIEKVRNFRDLIDIWKQEQEEKQKKEQIKVQVVDKTKKKSVKEQKPKKQTKKQQVKEVKQKEKQQKSQAEQLIRQRLGQQLAKSICSLKQLKYDGNNLHQTVSRILQLIKQQMNEPQGQLYQQPINHLIRCCLLLLKFKSPSTKQWQENGRDTLAPINIGRTVSLDNRYVNSNQVELLREWIENWKKWKGFKMQKVQLKFPVVQIVQFVNAWVHPTAIVSVIDKRYLVCEQRIQFYSLSNALLHSVMNPLRKYVYGGQILSVNEYDEGLHAVPHNKLNALKQLHKEYLGLLKDNEREVFMRLPRTLTQFQAKQSKNLVNEVKLIAEELCLIESENKNVDLEVALYFAPFKFMTHQHEELIFLAQQIQHRAYVSEHGMEEVVAALWKEVGSNDISKMRWKDFFFIQRMLFLLRKLEITVRVKQKYEVKVKCAELLFYVLYHLEVPLIAKIALRLLKKLDINLKNNLKTPVQHVYWECDLDCNVYKKVKEVKTQSKKNNLQLLAQKIQNIFQENIQVKQTKNNYEVGLSLHQEQDLHWLLKVKYYLEQMSGEKDKGYENWADYIASKGKKKEESNKKEANTVQQLGNCYELKEKIFSNVPLKGIKIDQSIEKQLPAGWFYNYCNIFKVKHSTPLKIVQPPPPLPKPTKNKSNAPVKRTSNNTIILKMIKKIEEVQKEIEEPKEDAKEQTKEEYVRLQNYFKRMKKYINDIEILSECLITFGSTFYIENVSREQALQVCSIFSLGSMNMLKDIPIHVDISKLTDKPIDKILQKLKLTQPCAGTNLKVSTLRSCQVQQFENLLKLQKKSESFAQVNKGELVQADNAAYYPYEDLIPPQSSAQVQFGKQAIEGGFYRLKKRYQEVHLKQYPNQRYFIAQGGIQTGIKDALLLPTSHDTVQSINLDSVLTLPIAVVQDTDDLIRTFLKLVPENKNIHIQCKQDIKKSLLLYYYLKKIAACELLFANKKLLTSLQNTLISFSLRSEKQLNVYEEQTNKLILKLQDNSCARLNIFQTYQHDATSQSYQFVNAPEFNKVTSKADICQETLSTHVHQKSQYLLKSFPSQRQANKLLNYWQKHILPKMHEFVKTSLQPYEMEYFFEQIRLYLRKNDHTSAKQAAYVVCDNKLPNGAVLPEANYNWNSLEVEETCVGDYVLIKKSKSQCISPLLHWGNQEYRSGKVINVDVKNSCVLVRYRVEELALFGYAWVPVNNLMALEKEIMQRSTENIYQELSSNIQGIISLYAKQCLSKLTNAQSSNCLHLLKENIIDMFIRNPISGCFNLHQEWSMRPILQQLLQKSPESILSMLQDTFCPVRSLQLDLLQDNITPLNRFSNAKALIVSFKHTAKISLCSGVRFYTDKYGYKEVAHVYATKFQKSDISPLQFTDPNVYFKYYTNKDDLQITQKNKYNLYPIPVTVYAVDEMWTVGCYLGTVICNLSTNLSVLARLNKVFIKWLLKRNVTNLCAYLAQLISKITLKIVQILIKKNECITLDKLSVTQEQMEELLTWVNEQLEQEEQDTLCLYSPLSQNLVELVSSILWKVEQRPELPLKITTMMQLMQMLSSAEGAKSKSRYDAWKYALVIKNMPKDMEREKLIEIVKEAKGKILTPRWDVSVRDTTGIILLDGWDLSEVADEEPKDVVKNEEAENEMVWICVCTTENPLVLDACCVCQSPKPPPKIVYENVQSVNIEKSTQKYQEKQSQMMPLLIESITKQANGNVIQFITGELVLKQPQMQEFIKNRLSAFPQNILQQVNKQTTSLQKISKLLEIGYDLWGDKIANEDAVLLPMNYLQLLMSYVQEQICKGTSKVLCYHQSSIRIMCKIPLVEKQHPSINYPVQSDIGVQVKYKALTSIQTYNIRHSWHMIRRLNEAAAKCLQMINMEVNAASYHDKIKFNDGLGCKVKMFKNLIMNPIKLELIQKVISRTSIPRETDQIPKISLERIKLREDREKNSIVKNKEKEEYLFTKAHDQFLKIAYAFLRPFKPRGAEPYLSFNVTFKGENVMGEAGPYRQFFTDIVLELEPKYNLGLFIASPNNKHQIGENKSRWMVNPKADSTYHFSLFEFIGILMGCCFRTNTHMALDLPLIFWKLITNEEVTDADLEETDVKMMDMMKLLKECPSEDALNQIQDICGDSINWVYSTSDEQEHELIPNGKQTKVQFQDLKKYIEMYKEKRIQESLLQIKRIVKGIGHLLPLPLLNVISAKELNLIMCGRPNVDVELLKKHTRYASQLSQDSPIIKFFWEVMRELDEQKKLKFIRFCWGQQRLPVTSEQFERSNIRFMIKLMPENGRNHDEALPKADTCFFNIELPNYSTKAILKEKILLVINLDCSSIDADDVNPEDNELLARIDNEYINQEQE